VALIIPTLPLQTTITIKILLRSTSGGLLRPTSIEIITPIIMEVTMAANSRTDKAS
jgi:hypothetical protein